MREIQKSVADYILKRGLKGGESFKTAESPRAPYTCRNCFREAKLYGKSCHTIGPNARRGDKPILVYIPECPICEGDILGSLTVFIRPTNDVRRDDLPDWILWHYLDGLGVKLFVVA